MTWQLLLSVLFDVSNIDPPFHKITNDKKRLANVIFYNLWMTAVNMIGSNMMLAYRESSTNQGLKVTGIFWSVSRRRETCHFHFQEKNRQYFYGK